MRILAIGECMAELAPQQNAGTYNLGFAGDTFNTAWYLAQISNDVDVAYLTAVGNDAISQQMRDMIVSSGIDDSPIMTVQDATVGLYLITLDNGERSFSYWRGQSAARQLANDPAKLNAAVNGADIVYFSGITLAILNAESRATLLAVLAAARANGKTIVFDPNLRPRLWPDTNTMTAAIMEGAAVSDVALPSFEDEAAWFQDADPIATADRYADAGATTIVVKNGEGPVLYRRANGEGTVTVTPIKDVTDTTAAGDSFNAAILAGIATAQPLPDSIAAACALAGKVVQSRGALVPITQDR